MMEELLEDYSVENIVPTIIQKFIVMQILLNAEQKTCIDLFYIKEKSYKEITDITGFTLKDVKSYIQNGKRNLKILMTKNMSLLLIFMVG